MLSQQIKNELPADLLLNIMQYACYKTHDNAKMIKKAVEDKHELKHHPWSTNCFGLIRISVGMNGQPEYYRYKNEKDALEYIEVDTACIVTDLNSHAELIGGFGPTGDVDRGDDAEEVGVVDWFEQVTDRYADCSDEYRDNLIIYCKMIGEVDEWGAEASARERAWGLYKIITDCPTLVY